MSRIEIVCDDVMEPLAGFPLPVEVTNDSFRPLWRGILYVCRPFWITDLADGRYSVRIAVPTGEVFTEVLDIVNQRPVSIDFAIELPKDAEGAEWAYFLNRFSLCGAGDEAPDPSCWMRLWQKRAERWEVKAAEGRVRSARAGVLSMDLRLSRNQHSLQIGSETLAWRNFNLPPSERLYTSLRVTEAGVNLAAICESEIAAEMLLSFMRVGAWRDAALLAAEVERRLLERSAADFDSAVSPLVLAYYYLMLGEPDRLAPLIPLMKGWDLPDVLVLASWQVLYDDKCDWDLVRRQLLMATVRGAPVYREGLVLLRDALKLSQYHFGEGDEQLNSARYRTAQYLLALEGEYPLAGYRGRNPWNPSTEESFGVPEPKSVLRFPAREPEDDADRVTADRDESRPLAMDDLLRAGAHFGHERRKWNPKMKPFIFGQRQKMHIIDLQQTLNAVQKAATVAQRIVSEGGQVLFVGTKAQASEIVEEEARRCGSPYVTKRWLGGLLTNFSTIQKSMAKLRRLDTELEDGTYYRTSKKEESRQRRIHQKLDGTLGGIRDLDGLPDLLYVVDAKRERIALMEARKLGIPVMAVADTDADPDLIDYVIPANDDAHRSIRLLTRTVADAVISGAPEGRGRGQT